MLKWKATRQRIFWQHKLTIMKKKKDTKLVGRWVARCKNTWGRKGEHDQNTFYKILNALLKIFFEEEFRPFNNNFKFEWPQLPNQKAPTSGMDWETNFLNFCWCETHATFKDTLFWVKSCKKSYWTKKQEGITILISEKIYLKVKLIRERRHLVLIKETVN